jgi:hypothetical protein
MIAVYIDWQLIRYNKAKTIAMVTCVTLTVFP